MNINFQLNDSKTVPIYHQIKEQVKEYILDKNLSGGTILPDLKTMASMAGVSIRTMDLGLKELIKEGVCYRRPKRGTFVAEFNGVNKKKILGVCLSTGIETLEANYVEAQIYRGITKTAREYAADVFIPSDDIDNVIEFYRRNDSFILDGIILSGCSPLEKTNALALKYPLIKFVYVNYYYKGWEDSVQNVYGVFNDDFAGAYQVASYMIDKGHRNFGLCSIEIDDENYRQRIKGFETALEENNIKLSPMMNQNFVSEKPFSQYDIGRKYAEEIFRPEMKTPDVIMCVNDMLAQGVLEYLFENNIKDVEVTGYDRIMSYLKKGFSFSTVAVDFEAIGTKAVDVIYNNKTTYPKTIRIMPQLIVS